jgi:hypothetical protein
VNTKLTVGQLALLATCTRYYQQGKIVRASAIDCIADFEFRDLKERGWIIINDKGFIEIRREVLDHVAKALDIEPAI